MKKKGSNSDFTRQRNAELYDAFRAVLRDSRHASLRDMFGIAAKRPCSRFWVSERHAVEVISRMRRAEQGTLDGRPIDAFDREIEKMLPCRRRMYDEIKRRVKQLMQLDTSLCLTHAVDRVVTSAAPEFYLEPETARILIYRHRRRLKALATLHSKKNNAYGHSRNTRITN